MSQYKNKRLLYFAHSFISNHITADSYYFLLSLFKKKVSYDISCKTLIGSKPLRSRFDKIGGIIRIYYRSRYLTLFGTRKYDAIYDKIRYLISIKSGITYTISHHFAKVKVDSYDSLPIEKTFTLHNVIMLTTTIYYYKIFLEKYSYQLAKK